eukprot:6209511-Pleurochrysis_carterae.AAC.4
MQLAKEYVFESRRADSERLCGVPGPMVFVVRQAHAAAGLRAAQRRARARATKCAVARDRGSSMTSEITT